MPQKSHDEKQSSAPATPEAQESQNSTDQVKITKRGTRIIEGTARLRKEGWGFLKTRSVTPGNALTGGNSGVPTEESDQHESKVKKSGLAATRAGAETQRASGASHDSEP